jgi:hypothetical protein
VATQFSAAVADTLASGGLVESATYGIVKHRYVYLAVMLLSVTPLWTSHIFEIPVSRPKPSATYIVLAVDRNVHRIQRLEKILASEPEIKMPAA